MSYNPQTGLVYIPTRGWDTFTYATNFDFHPDPSRAGGTYLTGLNLNTAGMTRQPAGPAIGPEPLAGGNLSTMIAYDPVKQEIRWRVPVGNSRYGGTLSTATNLVFQVAPDGRLIAYSADKGDKLFEAPSGLHLGLGPPMTFLVDGKQYVAFMGGTGGTASPGQNGTNGAPPPREKPRLVVFGLDGKAELPQSGTAAQPAPADPHQQ
jgi:quinohemoprotein ethanol dehydrogenase